MADPTGGRVAVYLDFDNIVMSWYDRVHGRNAYSRDRARIIEDPTEPEVAERLAAATIDVGAIIDYASSFGTLVLTRAYADWSSPVNAIYRSQLVARAVDLVQLFPAAAYAKNGADIRLAVDTVEDMFRLPDLTHVVIVAGDSDYVPLAQRCKRLGRYVIAVGVAGSTAKSLAAACDEFEAYDSLPGVPPIVRTSTPRNAPPAEAADPSPAPAKTRASGGRRGKQPANQSAPDAAASAAAGDEVSAGATAKDADAKSVGKGDAGDSGAAPSSDASEDSVQSALENALDNAAGTAGGGTAKRGGGRRAAAAKAPAIADTPTTDRVFDDGTSNIAPAATTPPKRANRRATSTSVAQAAAVAGSASDSEDPADDAAEEPAEDPQESATALLVRALRLGHDKDDSEWLHSSAVKTHMRRMDPSFSEKALGYRSFSDFVKARESVAELEETGHERLVRFRDSERD